MLLKGLLTRDPLRRLGAKGSSQVRRTAFFRPLDFRKVLERRYAPPFIPTLVGASPSEQALDTRNFDASFTDEDPSDEHPANAPPAPNGCNGCNGCINGTGHSAPPPSQPPPAPQQQQQPQQHPQQLSSSGVERSDAAVGVGREAAAAGAHAEAAFATWKYARDDG